jgi:SPP1 family predicted phage head-tail adaptor
MTAGEMRTRVTFLSTTYTQDQYSSTTAETEEVATVWGKVEYSSGNTFQQTGADHWTRRVKLTIRANPLINSRLKVLFKGSQYDIESLEPVEFGKIKYYVLRLGAEEKLVSGDGTISGLDPFGIAVIWAWYKADTGITKIEGFNGLTQWDDQTGNKHHLIRGASTAPFVIWEDNVLNGKPVCKFQSASITTKVTGLGGDIMPKITEGTFYVVARQKLGEGPGGYFLYSGDQIHIGRGFEIVDAVAITDAPPTIGGESGGGGWSAYAKQPATDNVFYSIRLRITANNFYVSLNNGPEVEGDKLVGFEPTLGVLTLGGLLGDAIFGANKDIAEVLCYYENHDETKRNEVEDYLNQRYNLY